MNSNPPEGHDTESDDLIETEIQDLQQRLEQARCRLRDRKAAQLNGASHELHNGGGTHQQDALTLNGEPHPLNKPVVETTSDQASSAVP